MIFISFTEVFSSRKIFSSRCIKGNKTINTEQFSILPSVDKLCIRVYCDIYLWLIFLYRSYSNGSLNYQILSKFGAALHKKSLLVGMVCSLFKWSPTVQRLFVSRSFFSFSLMLVIIIYHMWNSWITSFFVSSNPISRNSCTCEYARMHARNHRTKNILTPKNTNTRIVAILKWFKQCTIHIIYM